MLLFTAPGVMQPPHSRGGFEVCVHLYRLLCISFPINTPPEEISMTSAVVHSSACVTNTFNFTLQHLIYLYSAISKLVCTVVSFCILWTF